MDVTSSIWATESNTLQQLNVALDGNPIATGKLWSNGASTHRALPTLFIGFPLSFGPHTLTLSLSGQNVPSAHNAFFNPSPISSSFAALFMTHASSAALP